MINTTILINIFNTITKISQGDIIKISEGPRLYNIIIHPSKSEQLSNIRKLAKEYNTNVTIDRKTGNLIFEIAKTKPESVSLQKILKSIIFSKSKGILPIALGVDITGTPVIKDLTELPHLLICGRTGTGKTTLIKTIMKSLLSHESGNETSFMVIDTKNYDFDNWADRHLMMPIINDELQAISELEKLTNLVDTRYEALNSAKAKNIVQYNKKNPKNKMSFIVVIIDEFADLMAKNNERFEACVQTIAQKARAVGIHLIMATQHLEKVTNFVLANMPTRIVFQTKDEQDSIKILDESCAEILQRYGDTLLSEAGRIPIRIHTPKA